MGLSWPSELAGVPDMFRERRYRAASSGIWLHTLERDDAA